MLPRALQLTNSIQLLYHMHIDGLKDANVLHLQFSPMIVQEFKEWLER